MQLAEGIETGREYYWKRSEGWKWLDGATHWWEVFVEFSALNGAGGAWLVERWRWNGSHQTLREDVRTLSHEDTMEIIAEIRKQAAEGGGREER